MPVAPAAGARVGLAQPRQYLALRHAGAHVAPFAGVPCGLGRPGRLRVADGTRVGAATLACGGKRPSDPALQKGYFIEPTVFTNVRADMRIAREEIFGPVLSVIKWSDEETMFEQVNSVEYGLTGAVFTRDLAIAHRAASRIEAGLVWVNNSSSHFLGTGFGGYKQSGLGRDESIEELMFYTQPKNINITL